MRALFKTAQQPAPGKQKQPEEKSIWDKHKGKIMAGGALLGAGALGAGAYSMGKKKMQPKVDQAQSKVKDLKGRVGRLEEGTKQRDEHIDTLKKQNTNIVDSAKSKASGLANIIGGVG